MTQPDTELPWNRRFRGWLRRNWLLDTAWRLTVFIVGATLICVGALLLILPGPGWAMIAIGLVVLASEYVWAQRLLHPLRKKLAQAKQKASQPQYRTQVRIMSASVVVLMGVAIGAYVLRYGFTLDGVRGLWPL